MYIKIGGYYTVKADVGTLIVKVMERLEGEESRWLCHIHAKEKDYQLRVRRNKFKVHLGINLEDALEKSAEYFI